MIEVEGLSKRFGTTIALNDVSMGVERGEIVGLLGPNGAGKTTMMRIITGYLAPTSGRVRVAGRDVQEEPLAVKRGIGYLPETVPVYAELTVREYLRFTAALHDLPTTGLEARINACMEQTGTAEVAHRLIGHLSKGFRQRLGVAQALLHDPDLLILDEPTVGLDPTQVVEIRGLIRELARNHTVILSSHILPEVSQICSRIIIIDRGRIVAVGTQEELEKSIKGAENIRVEMRGAGPDAAEIIGGMPGVVGVRDGGAPGVLLIESDLGRDVRADLFNLAHQRGWTILEMRTIEMSLEEMFSRFTRPAGESARSGGEASQ
jgi:ABC-2 type transport system ATP-binding protein